VVAIQLAQLENLYTDVSNANALVHSSFVALSQAAAVRNVSFQPLSALVTRAYNAFKVSGVPQPLIDSAKPFVMKIRGQRVSAKIKTDAVQATDGATTADPVIPTPKQNSVSQVSFDSLLDNFDKFINILEYSTDYKPNEEQLKANYLSSRYNTMNAENKLVMDAQVVINTYRFNRQKIMYDPETGLLAQTTKVKVYLKSVFGTSSDEFKQASKLTFTKLN